MADIQYAGARYRSRASDGGAELPISPHKASELVWLLEHSPRILHLRGPAADPQNLLATVFRCFTTGPGGQLTYHVPASAFFLAYVMLDLKRRRPDVRAYVAGP